MFEKTVHALWRFFGLEPEEINPDFPPVLELDDLEVELGNAPDETAFECRIVAGVLSNDPRWRGTQIEWILRHNAALLPFTDACVYIRSKDASVDEVVFLLRFPYETLDMDFLAQELELVLETIPAYAEALDVGVSPALSDDRGAGDFSSEEGQEEELLFFRP